jgi:hypothetical protein
MKNGKNRTGKYSIECEICHEILFTNEKYKCLNNLYGHLKKWHNIKQKDYLLKYIDIIPADLLEENKRHACEWSKNKYRAVDFVKQQNLKLLNKIGEEKYKNLPACEICGYRTTTLYNHILKIHEISVEEYKKKYNSRIETDEYLSSKSIRISGEKNPMYNKNRPECSPFSSQFYILKGYNEKDAIFLANKKKKEVKIIRENLPPSSFPTNIDYFKNKFNVSDDIAYKMLKERQQRNTNSIKNIARRKNISIEEATTIRNKITSKWLNTMNSKSVEELAEINRRKIPDGVSNSSIIFFDFLIDTCKLDIKNIYYNKNEFWLNYISNGNNKFYFYDFKFKNKIIEYNGDMYHGNPKIFKADDCPLKRFPNRNLQNRKASDMWNYDKLKMDLAISKGYNVLTIWESEVKENKYTVLEKCKEFLFS